MVRLTSPRKPKVSKAEAMGIASKDLLKAGSLSIPKAADFLGIHKYTLREYIEGDLVESFVIGSRNRVAEDELLRLKRLIEEHGSLTTAFRNLQEPGAI